MDLSNIGGRHQNHKTPEAAQKYDSTTQKNITTTSGDYQGEEKEKAEQVSPENQINDIAEDRNVDITGNNLNSDIHGEKDVDEKVNGYYFPININSAVAADEERKLPPNGVVLQARVVQPHSHLPKPEAPREMVINPTTTTTTFDEMEDRRSSSENFHMPAIGKFIREKSQSLSEAITKRLSSFKESNNNNDDDDDDDNNVYVTEFKLSGVKVIANYNNKVTEQRGGGRGGLQGRVSFFSRSNCRDCSAVRSFLRERKLNYVEINIDVYPKREKELIDRTGSATVPQIFFNDKLIGGLVALNSLRNSGLLDKKLDEMLVSKCPVNAPAPPAYGFDDDDDDAAAEEDPMVSIVWVLRQRLPIRDRLMKMKIVKNCFSGSELVEVLIHHLDCGRRKAVETGKQLARKHFIHHVFGENEFEDGNHFYRFLEHETFIPKCYNFRGFTNDSEPKAAALLTQRLSSIMSAILESYASDDRHHLDYVAISNSEEFRRYINLVQDLQRLDISTLSVDEKLAFFLNLYNAMVIHAVIRIGYPGGMIDRKYFFSDFMYIVGGYPFSLSTITNGILRSNKRAPFSFVKPLGSGDKRLELAFPKVNILIHFGLCNAAKSGPAIKFFSHGNVESELRYAAREFFQRDEGLKVDLAKRTVYLSKIIKWYNVDFGQEKEVLKWIINYLDATKAGLLTHALGDGGPVNVVYQNFDWSLNS